MLGINIPNIPLSLACGLPKHTEAMGRMVHCNGSESHLGPSKASSQQCASPQHYSVMLQIGPGIILGNTACVDPGYMAEGLLFVKSVEYLESALECFEK